ncbi:hypothetical protein [Yersinia similis]|uniref:hypothetical protein n=1 Tax=Yersinia similis TaxID=367190 RepID=UPI00384B19A2
MEQLAQLPPLWAQGQGDALLATGAATAEPLYVAGRISWCPVNTRLLWWIIE